MGATVIVSIVFATLLGTSAVPAPQVPQGAHARPALVPLRVVPDLREPTPWDQESKAMFFRLADRDGDGFASAVELDRSFARRESQVSPSIKFLEERDANHDGRLSLDEVLSHPM